MRDEGDEKALWFASGGRGMGIAGLVAVAAFLLYGVLDRSAGFPAWLYPLCLLCCATIWVVLVRPSVRVDAGTLELRNMLHSRWVPLARVTEVNVGQMIVVQADGRKYVGSGVSRTRRQIRRDARHGAEGRLQDRSYGWIVEHRLRRLAADARERGAADPPATRRRWAWPEIVALVASALATAVLALV